MFGFQIAPIQRPWNAYGRVGIYGSPNPISVQIPGDPSVYRVYSSGLIERLDPSGTTERITLLSPVYPSLRVALAAADPGAADRLQVGISTSSGSDRDSVIGQLFSLFSRSSTPEEREAAAGMAADYAQQYGPGVFDSLSSWISGIGQSRTALQRRLFKLQAQYATADESKRAELDWKIRALQAQINEYDMQVGSMNTEIAPPETPTISPWILGAAAFAALLGGTLYLTRKK